MGNYKHGMEGTRTYASWVSMKDRCNRPGNNRYMYYGGRGIGYDPRWEEFINFYSDMGKRPPNTTLERKDSNLPYSKDNCVWATAKQQANNRRNTIWLTHEGDRRPLAEWARFLGVTHSVMTTRYRYYKNNPQRLFAELYNGKTSSRLY